VAPDGRRDVAIVLSGGGINGVLLELGFLKRMRETALWPRVGWIYGTSAGAVAGSLAALDRLDDLEEFMLALQPAEAFRPRPLWRFPGGLHDYTLPETIASRLGDTDELGRALGDAEIELVVFATDLTNREEEDGARHYELAYPSHSTPPDTMGRAILASAAISALVLPIRVDGVIATDGGWVRNFPLAHAYRNPAVHTIAAFRYVASYRPTDLALLARVRDRLDRFRAVPPVRALLAEIRLAEERAARGEPAHYGELIIRLMRVAIARNTVLEEHLAADREASVTALQGLRRERLRAQLEGLFATAPFPFRHDRHVPTLIVRGTPGEDGLDPTFRDEPWPEERKRALIDRGYEVTHAALAASEELRGVA
jgi:predicted acylesterase/phospholipase RssA